ncbi:MAG: hypothetical protein IKC51_06535, partial [Myxococcaceae bacterium]|nr:hypothetical protein [Myxococcaceae bacterium]
MIFFVLFLKTRFLIAFCALAHGNSKRRVSTIKDALPNKETPFHWGATQNNALDARANLKPLQRGAIVDFRTSPPGVCSILHEIPPKTP